MTEIVSGDVPQMLAMGIAATERGEHSAALQLLSAVYKVVPADKMPQGLSSYGLCLARVEKKNKAGIDLCQKAIQLEFYEGKHWANLVRLYIIAKSRKKAVETLENGLKRLPTDPALLRVRQEIGYRQTPSLSFLTRQNPMNKLFSRTAGKVKIRGKLTRGLIILLSVIAALLYAGIIFEIFHVIVK